MNREWTLILLLILFAAGYPGFAQESLSDISVMFYNVENLFDPFNDPDFQDDEFTPEGSRYWTEERLQKKVNHLYKTVIASGNWDPPALIGLCEVENREVLDALFIDTPLSKYQWEIIHYDSNDERGIDVALVARTDVMKVIRHRILKPVLESGIQLLTRDILYVKGLIGKDTLHVLVHHWPSRRSSINETAPLRWGMAGLTKKIITDIFSVDRTAKIIMMGDLNDELHDESLTNVLRAGGLKQPADHDRIYGFPIVEQPVPGTYKYHGRWYHFDHFLVSGTLIQDEASMHVDLGSFRIIAHDFLLMEDELYLGIKPFPTFYGYQYVGGFSDHLPICLGIKVR